MASPSRQRVDRWLWFARIVRTRTLAAELVATGRVRLNRSRIAKPGHGVAVGDVLTLALPGGVRVVRIAACAERRGPAPAARLLYADLAMSNGDGTAPQIVDAREPGTC